MEPKSQVRPMFCVCKSHPVLVFLESLSAQHRAWLKATAAMQESSEEDDKDDDEDADEVEPGDFAEDDQHGDLGSLGGDSHASIAASLLFDESVGVTPIVLSPQSNQRSNAVAKPRRAGTRPRRSGWVLCYYR